MGPSASRSYMCCAVRDKDGGESYGLGKVPQFSCIDTEAPLLEEACFLSYSPLYQQEASKPRRLAVASAKEVCIYRLPEPMDDGPSALSKLTLSHRLRLEEDRRVSALLFCEEDSSRHVAVAFRPSGKAAAATTSRFAAHIVKIFSCDATGPMPGSTGEAPSTVVDWTFEKGCDSTLEGHTDVIVKLAANRAYLVSADLSGQVCAWQKGQWQKSKPLQRKASVLCHAGGIADLSVDRSFAYTVSREENRVCIWSLPELTQVLSLPIDLTEDLLNGLTPPLPPPQALVLATTHQVAAATAATAAETVAAPAGPAVGPLQSRIARVNLVRRPLSRWAGSPGITTKGGLPGRKTPRGCLFVAAILGGGCEVAGLGAGVLTEWNLGDRPGLTGVQIAHDTPIVSLVYGPYDNGPLITADMRGVFRVWEFSLDRGLQLSQQIVIQSQSPAAGLVTSADDWSRFMSPACAGWPAVAVEPPRAVYVIVSGRLFIWQRQLDASHGPVLSPRSPTRPSTASTN
mmetsp:Transcript_89122/g.232402  ORF Transcript_89122/g.232402 Transcript_89122/m.232402 type:complete len:514 (+) Transcript_89122:105-1646(+)